VEIIESLKKKLHKKEIFSSEALETHFRTVTKSETQQVCRKIIQPYLISLECLLLIEEPVLLKISFVKEIQYQLEEKILSQGINLSELEKYFPNLDSGIFRRILKYLGFQIQFKSLLEEWITLPKTRKVITSGIA
jgi:hypothetical protein